MSKKHERPYNHTTKLGTSWRRPKGLHSKRRLQHKGHAGLVKIGRRGKASQRHKYQEKEVITVQTKQELDALKPESQAARIPKMGRKKKTPLIIHAQENNITIVNLDADTYIKQTEDILNHKQRSKEKTQTKNTEDEEQTTKQEKDADEDEEESSEQKEQKNTKETKDMKQESSAPTSNNTIPEIKEWLDENNVEYTSSLRKAELLDLVKENK